MAVRTVLRNRVYLGEVFFHDAWHPGQHQPLVDQAVIEALLATFQQTDLFEQAVASRTQAELLHEQHQAELATVTEQIRKAEATIERYLDAFEAGTMSADTCGQRVEKQGAKIAELRVRQADLRHVLDAVDIQAPTRQELADLADQVRVALSEGPTPARKRLLHTLVHEVQVQGRDAIFPVFRVPGGQPPAGSRCGLTTPTTFAPLPAAARWPPASVPSGRCAGWTPPEDPSPSTRSPVRPASPVPGCMAKPTCAPRSSGCASAATRQPDTAAPGPAARLRCLAATPA